MSFWTSAPMAKVPASNDLGQARTCIMVAMLHLGKLYGIASICISMCFRCCLFPGNLSLLKICSFVPEGVSTWKIRIDGL